MTVGICGKALEVLGVDITQYNSAVSVRDIGELVKLAGFAGQYRIWSR
jgi:hypothetical protein